jgi:hypothetical protein
LASFINYFNKTDFIVSRFIKYGGVFLGGDPAKGDEDHKSRSAPVGRDRSFPSRCKPAFSVYMSLDYR